MSKLITLDEAIEWGKRGELCELMTEDDQRQVAEWLRQARGAESAARWYTAKLRDAHHTIRKLLNENAKLREERDRYKAMYESVHVTAAELRRVRREWQRDREQNAELREERREYQATIDSLVDECADHKAENDKLRELVKDSVSLLCETCDTYYESDYHAIVDRARELGIEVTP